MTVPNPAYRTVDVSEGGGTVIVCTGCGVVVADTAAHSRDHADRARLEQRVRQAELQARRGRGHSPVF